MSTDSAVKKAMNLLLYKDRTEFELSERLHTEGFSPDEINEALEYTRSFGYLNDKRYAENFVLSFQGKKSRNAIAYALREKHVDEKWIEDALALISEDESEVILALLIKKAGPPHHLTERELRRALGFLGRRGYDSRDIWKVIHLYQSEE